MPELDWDGKYDEEGHRAAPLRVALPFQTVETVNESAQERQRSLDIFSAGRAPDWRNRLIWGDKKYVLPALLDEFAGKVDLIYIDPPFATGQDFSFPMNIEDTQFVKEPSLIEVKAYRDTWGRGLDSYLDWFYGMAVHLEELLSEKGSLYVHLDPGISHAVKALLDEVLGRERFINEIVWKRSDAKGDIGQGSKHFGRVNDVLLFYSKSDARAWNPHYAPLDPEYVEKFYRYTDPDGRRYKLDNMTGPGGAAKGNPLYEVMGVTRYWRYSRERMEELINEGRVIQTNPGTVPMYKRYLDESKGTPLTTNWNDISFIRGWSSEKIQYPTQKPEALLERIIGVSSNEGDLVLDCVCGSGTTAVVAEKLNRRWIAADLGRFAIHTARKRLLSVPDVQPFIVQNLGKYERQLWQKAEFGDKAATRTAAYRDFILSLYHAKPIGGHSWLHGIKGGRMVHVSTVDAPVTVGDIKQIAAEFRKVIGTGKDAPTSKSVDILGWDFAFEVNEVARQDAAKAGIELRFIRIQGKCLTSARSNRAMSSSSSLPPCQSTSSRMERRYPSASLTSLFRLRMSRRTCSARSANGPSGSTTGRSTGITRTTPSTTIGSHSERARKTRSTWTRQMSTPSGERTR
jgi:adenine-specific DNA-methyltransferase